MLVTFSCPYYAHITFFGDIAIKILNIMQHSGQVPGAFSKDEVAHARAHLKTFIDLAAKEDLDEDKVSLRKRAIPLLPLFDAAVENQCAVYWE